MPLTIRRATQDDLDAITEIYNSAAVATTASYDIEPVTRENRALWMAAHETKNHPILVLVDHGSVVGYANYTTFRDKAGYAHTVEHSVYITQQCRSSGGGRMLMSALIDHARSHGVHVMLGVIDGENEESLAFHSKMGFEESGRLREVGYKFGRWLDVVIMSLKVG